MARIEVPMPQMGESIAEGTVSKWLKKVGDPVERDEPILEISTDKVDAEIPAPQGGILTEVLVGEGEMVEVGTILAYIDSEGVGSRTGTASEVRRAAGDSIREITALGSSENIDGGERLDPLPTTGSPAPAVKRVKESTAEERLRQWSTPIVRRMAKEHGVDLAELEGYGSGPGGRVTKQDLLKYLGGDEGEGAQPIPGAEPYDTESLSSNFPQKEPSVPPPTGSAAPAVATELSELWKSFYGQVQHQEFPVREGDIVETMDRVRRLTAEHMVLAKRIAPHVHSFIEIDFSEVDRIRQENQQRWSEQGVRVSLTALVAWGVSRTLLEFPMLNATASGNNVIYRGNVNLGIAVDLDPGLIVPVICDSDDLSLVEIVKKIVDLAARARARQLEPAEIQDGTFTITNPGVLGTLAGMPIVPKGTAGILAVGEVAKRVVAISEPDTGVDSIEVRKRSIFTLGYDHRIVDGADAARFLVRLKQLLEEFPDDAQ